jgi:hypothetical protein
MSVERLIESIGLSAVALKRYVLAEIDEFLDAADPADREEEFGDILFALMSMAWAHSGHHYAIRPEVFEAKVKQRLRTHATLTRHPRQYLHDRIPELEFGVLHFAFGQFKGQWKEFDALKNGTVAEIHLLTDAPFERPDNLANQCIITFDDNDGLEYDIIEASSDTKGGNIVLCRIPDFMFLRAKRQLQFVDFAELLSLQVLAALDALKFVPGAIAHFHSWESGFLTDSAEFCAYINPFKAIFSPYLTATRLKSLIEQSGGLEWTMTRDELAIASAYERKLSEACMRIVLESTRDRDFYSKWVDPNRLEVRSFARARSASFPSDPADDKHLTFIAGGRPVREKGFVELCQQFVSVRNWAADRGLTLSLSILCRERRRDKGEKYIQEIEHTIVECGLTEIVEIEPKISLDQLLRRIAEASALIVPSLYDPFGLMPAYAVEVKRPAFVSCHAGISENITSGQFTFDPLEDGALLRAVTSWYEERPLFEYESRFPSYRGIYLANEFSHTWQ